MEKCCGNCAWLDVPAESIKKNGEVHKRLEYRMFNCRVPFERPEVPSSVRVEWGHDNNARRMMAPIYGAKCSFHKPRDTAKSGQGLKT